MPQPFESQSIPSAAFELREARVDEAPILAKMMVEGLDSRLNDLGPWFVTHLHRHIITSRHCVCLVADLEGKILGYFATAVSSRKFYREFLLRKGVVSAMMVLPWVLRPRNLHTIIRGLTYFPETAHDEPDCKGLSLIIVPEARGKKVGTALFLKTMDCLRERGVPSVTFSTGVDNVASNAFFRRYGGRLLASKKLYRDVGINVYIFDQL